MKKHLLDWILWYAFWVLLLALGQFIFTMGAQAYYTYMPIETFYKTTVFHAEDACLGDTSHLIHSQRHVYGTDIGYGAELIREMYLVKEGTNVKVVEEDAMAFVEVRVDGLVTREQKLPTNLKEGNYQWVVYLTLNIHGVQRRDIPPLVSNLFSIKKCV